MRRLPVAPGPLAAAVAVLTLTGPAGPSAPLAAQQLPGWAHGGVCYQIFVRSFQDSDGDGVGDFRGLIDRLDYVNDGDPTTRRDLGASCIWLLPIHPSPSYHGYDVTDYRRVNPEYGTEADFRRFVAEAHARGIRVLLDLVPNHVSSEHPIFKQALLDPSSAYRPWFLFRPEPGPPNEWGQVTWHPSWARDEYYYGFFYSGMPDLDWTHGPVRDFYEEIARFWLEDMGVDGFRLDAVRHLMEDESGRTTNVPSTHEALRDLADRIRAIDPGSLTIGEVFDSTTALLRYYPDQLDAYFAFDVGDRILEGVREESFERVVETVLRLEREIPDRRYAPFLRNHDQRRTLTELDGDRVGARMASALLLTLPGLPFVYYGEEIGMQADKPDPRLRTPMQWEPGPGAGFTTGRVWEPLQPDSMTVTVAALDGDPASLLTLHRTLIHARSEHPGLARGRFVPVRLDGAPGVTAWLRTTEDRMALVVANPTRAPVPSFAWSAEVSPVAAGGYTLAAIVATDGSLPEGGQARVDGGGVVRGVHPGLPARTVQVFDLLPAAGGGQLK